jgi:hypothetical protein
VDPLLDMFRVSLEAERKSPGTVSTYLTTVGQLAAFTESRGLDWHEVRPLDCQAWIADILRRGCSQSWGNVCVCAGKMFFPFCEEYLWDGEHQSPMAKMKTARVHARPKTPLADDRLAAVIEACKAEPDRFTRRRDEAIFRSSWTAASGGPSAPPSPWTTSTSPAAGSASSARAPRSGTPPSA